MAANVASLLDKAKVIHSLPSDYKLALVLGVQQTTLTNYRHGKTLPYARVIRSICDLTGDDPALLLAEVEAERAKTSEARALWLEVVQRLRSTLHAAFFACLVGAAGFGGLPSTAEASDMAGAASSQAIHRGMWARSVWRRLVARWAPAVRYLAGLFGSPCHA